MKVLEKKDISNSIECILRQKPSSIGKRLCSEEILAGMFRVGRWQLRSSLDTLVTKGVLVRRKGSGTYVGKIPPNSLETADNLKELPRISAQKLFADSNETVHKTLGSSQLARSTSNLNISLWSGMHCSHSESNQIILGSITRRIASTGNHLFLNTMMERPNVIQPISETARQLRANASDGYLVYASWVKPFKEALGGREVPVLYFADYTYKFVGEPLLICDNYRAINTAVDIFAREGYQRIALIGLCNWQNDQDERFRIYKAAMVSAGLSYEKCLFVEARNCMVSLRETLSRDDRPDAIYVSDDTMMNEVVIVMNMLKLVPGRDIGIISQSVSGRSLPTGYKWSQLEFDIEYLGELAVNDLLSMITSKKILPYNTILAAKWKAGQTHKRC